MIAARFRLTVMEPEERIVGNGHWIQSSQKACFFVGGDMVASIHFPCCSIARDSYVVLYGDELRNDGDYYKQIWLLDYLDSLPGVTDGTGPTQGPP